MLHQITICIIYKFTKIFAASLIFGQNKNKTGLYLNLNSRTMKNVMK